MAGLLTWLMSKGDTAKRNLRAIARDPVGMIDLMALQIAEDIRGTKYEREQDLARLLGNPYEKAAVDSLDRKRQDAALSFALTFAGPFAKTANKGLLAKAQEMTKEGASPFDVWQQTGWTDQFPDRKWRFEINDRGAKWQQGERTAGFGLRGENALLKHTDVDKAYPHTRTMDWVAFDAPSVSGSYSPARAENANTFGGDEFVAIYGPEASRKKTGLHELQHAIQHAEGFARGGSPQSFAKEVDPMGAYRRLAGEAEARLVEKRMNYTPEMRRAVAPWQQFDVPIDQQIVRVPDSPAAIMEMLLRR